MDSQQNQGALQKERVATRLRVLKAGKILFKDWRTIDVAVRDLSATGAKIMCSIPENVPEKIRLVLPADNIMRHATVVWRKSDSLGVTFSGDAEPAPEVRLQKPHPGDRFY